MKTTRFLAGFLSVCALSAFPLLAHAAPGSLDTTFDSDGWNTTVFNPTGGITDSQINDVVIQSDGKILSVGQEGASGSLDFALARYTTAGALDTTFGTSGKVSTDFGGSEVARSVKIQADGKFIVAGNSSSPNANILLARYTTAGALDTTFGTGGKVSTDFGSGTNDFVYSVTIQSDGKFVVAGTSGGNVIVLRYTTAGALDTTFGTGGKVTTDFGGTDTARDVAIQSTGKIVIVGNKSTSSAVNVIMARYTTAGALDTTFGSSGKVTTSFSTWDETSRFRITADDKIFVSARSTPSSTINALLARYNANGTLDNTFGSSGTVSTNFGVDSSGIDRGFAPGSVLVQSDGRIVAVGTVNNNPNAEDFAIVRYNTNGSLDTSFGTGGKVITHFGSGSDSAYAVAIQSDQKLVVAGRIAIPNFVAFGVARYQGTTTSALAPQSTSPSAPNS